MKVRAIPLLEAAETASKLNASINGVELDHSNLKNDEFYFELNDVVKEPYRFVQLLDQYKAIILQKSTSSEDRDHEEDYFTVNDFGQFVVDLKLDYYPYIGGAAPRTIIPVPASPDRDIVFTANESPPDQPIPFHHELAQTPNPPKYIFFFCETPSEGGGGETPIIDSTAVYRFVKDTYPDYLEKLLKSGVRYLRTLPEVTDPDSPIGRSYKETYDVSSREELDDKLRSIDGCSWEWNSDGSVRIVSAAIPAVRLVDDASTKNYIFQYTFCNSIIAAYLGWQDCRNDRKNAVRFGDMSIMDEAVLESIASFMHSHRILYPWRKGDILAINNQLIMHSRNPFVGKRRVLASIWGPLQSNVLHSQPPCGVAVGIRPHYEPIVPSDPLTFGFWKVPHDVCADVCYNAIKAGYRRLDCACDYGNEVYVGIGIKRAIEDKLCTRQELFVTSKLWNTYHEPQYVKLACQRSLQDLQLDYLDEYLIHFPISMEYVPFDKKYPPEWLNLDGKMVIIPNDTTSTTWKAMEALVDEGLCRTIGVCNFSTQLLRQLLATCRIRPSTLQIEIHPQNTQIRLVRFAQQAGMKITAFSIFGATSYVELNMATVDQSLLVQPSSNNDKDRIDSSVIATIAAAKKKTQAQIILRWCIQRNIMPLCKSIRYERMIENRDVFDFYLTAEEVERINSLNVNRRYNDPGQFCEEAFHTFCPIYD